MKGQRRKAGAPLDGRVHTLLYELRGEFLREYELEYNYIYKNYYFARKEGYLWRFTVDCFIIVKTSRRCIRAMYYNSTYRYFKYFSARTAKELATYMKNIYFTFKEIEQ